MSIIGEALLKDYTYYMETGLRHGYPLRELMWVVLSSQKIIDVLLRGNSHFKIVDIIKQQHDLMVERYNNKLKGNNNENSKED